MDPVWDSKDSRHFSQRIISRDQPGVGIFVALASEFVALASDQPGIAIRCHAYVKEMRAKGHEVGGGGGGQVSVLKKGPPGFVVWVI